MRWIVAAAVVAGCTPELADETSIVGAPRVLAVRAEPAEAAPGSPVQFAALWVGAEGALADAPLDWSFCTARKPFTAPGSIDPSCVDAGSPALTRFGTGAAASAALPADGCHVFGPDRPDPLPGQPAGRPADPDGTGGYYAPVMVDDRTPSFTLAEMRIRCGLPAATPAQSASYQQDYRANVNPTIEGAAIERAGSEIALTALETDPGARAPVAAGEVVHLIVRWPVCDDLACGGAERYLWFDPDAHALTNRREELRVSWFATGGTFETGHTGVPEAEADRAASEDRWTAPSAPGEVLLWIVLRDDRGGTTWASYRLGVGD